MKKIGLLIVFLGLASGIFGGCHSSPQLSESGQALSRLFEIADQLELEKAKLEGAYERQQKTIAFNQLIIQAEERILKENQNSQAVPIGGQIYSVEEITADLNQRQEKVKQLEAQAAKSHNGLDRQLNWLEAQNKLVASAKGNLALAGQKEEILLAELQALLTFKTVANSLKISSAKKSADRLAEALKAFQYLLDQARIVPGDLEAMEAIDAGLLLDGKNPVIPNSRWINYLETDWVKEQAEAEKQKKSAEEEKNKQAEAEKQKKAAEEEKSRQAEAEKQRQVKEEEQQRQQAEVEKQRKTDEEEQHRQAEAEQAIAEATKTIVRTVSKLDRSLTPQQVLDATGLRQFTKQSVVAAMPSGGKDVEENVTVEFFKLDCIVSNNRLAREYKERGLTPDPYAQARVNADDPAFIDEHPNSTYWKDADGNWCFATFCRNNDERIVHICHGSDGWNAIGGWWFGGVRKEEQRQQAEAEKKRKERGDSPDSIIADWQSFWQKFGIEANLSAVKIPEHQPEFSRILIIPEGLTLNQAIQFCKDRFPVSSYWNDLDKAIVANDRRPTQAYAVRLRDRQEADEELKNLLPNDLAKKKIAGVTLLERLVYELKYFDETGDHLDKTSCTLCSGSRDVGGYIPYIHWPGGRLDVIWYNPGFAYGHLRARAVVF